MMSSCARCGQGVCTAVEKIALNKIWHKVCFNCYSCRRPLTVDSAKVFYGEVFCNCCCPKITEFYPIVKPACVRVNSSPSFCPGDNNLCCGCPNKPTIMRRCESTASLNEGCCAKDVHSCSCIPACCGRRCDPCDPCCPPKPAHCRPRSPKPCNYPPRQRSPSPCRCPRCCPPRCPPPRRRITCVSPPLDCCYPPPQCCQPPTQCCQPPKCSPRKCTPPTLQCLSSPCEPKRVVYCPPPRMSKCQEPPCCCRACKYNNRCGGATERCRRCGEKVFAAEKILTSCGAYHVGCFSCCCCCKSLCVKTMFEASGEIYCKQCYNNYFGLNVYGYCS